MTCNEQLLVVITQESHEKSPKSHENDFFKREYLNEYKPAPIMPKVLETGEDSLSFEP